MPLPHESSRSGQPQPKGTRDDLVQRLRDPSISGEAAKVLVLEAADALAQAPAPAHGRWIDADDVDRLVRELDVALNGDAAAPQAKLCDIVAEVQRTRRQPLTPEWAYELIGRHASNRLVTELLQVNEARDGREVCPDVVEFMGAIMRTAGVGAEQRWQAMLYAPRDGSKIELLVEHHEYWIALKNNRPDGYRQECEGSWVDFNGGGWSWMGTAGQPIGWRPLRTGPVLDVPLYPRQAPRASAPKPWPELLPLLNDYAMAMTDAAQHQAASKVDIAKTQAMKALARLRAAIYGDEKNYGEVQG